jgi:hypothetical protein
MVVRLLKALKELSQLDADSFVPGHGPAGTIYDLKLMIDYVEQCLETAQMLVGKGDSYKDRIPELKIDEIYQHWQLSQFYQSNIGFLCERLSPANGDK